MNIGIIGLGYVGLSNALLLGKYHQVFGVDLNSARIEQLCNRKSPLIDPEIETALQSSTVIWNNTIADITDPIDFWIIATPTDYDDKTDYFDTSSITSVLNNLQELYGRSSSSGRADAVISVVIKSTIPVGFTQEVQIQYPNMRIIFMPEFLREGTALKDNYYPSRIVVGNRGEFGQMIAQLYSDAALNQPQVELMDSTEAEATKLFANTYLAMRVGFFNELDSFALAKGLDTQRILKGVSSDPRIGDGYNNPSFGYGGYCLPKDTKQLKANFRQVPHALVSGIVEANRVRKDFIAEKIIERLCQVENPIVGVYRLAMKQGSDNFRQSSILGVMGRLSKADVTLQIFEPGILDSEFLGHRVEPDLDKFKNTSHLIIANRWDEALSDISSKVFTRDIFYRD
jgi:UDPglucose 6-dehydrogenase